MNPWIFVFVFMGIPALVGVIVPCAPIKKDV